MSSPKREAFQDWLTEEAENSLRQSNSPQTQWCVAFYAGHDAARGSADAEIARLTANLEQLRAALAEARTYIFQAEVREMVW